MKEKRERWEKSTIPFDPFNIIPILSLGLDHLQTAVVAEGVLTIFWSMISAHLPGEAGIIFCGGSYWKQDSRIERIFVLLHCQNIIKKEEWNRDLRKSVEQSWASKTVIDILQCLMLLSRRMSLRVLNSECLGQWMTVSRFCFWPSLKHCCAPCLAKA